MVVPIEKPLFDFLFSLVGSLGVYMSKCFFQRLHFFDVPADILFAAVATTRYAMDHQSRIPAHINRFATGGNRTRHTCRYTIHINCNVGCGVTDRIEDRNTCIYFTTHAVNTNVYLVVGTLDFHQLAHDVTATHIRIVPTADSAI